MANNFDPSVYAGLDDEKRKAVLESLGLGHLGTDQFFGDDSDDADQIAAIRNSLKVPPTPSSAPNPYAGEVNEVGQPYVFDPKKRSIYDGEVDETGQPYGAVPRPSSVAAPVIPPGVPGVAAPVVPGASNGVTKEDFLKWLNTYSDASKVFADKQAGLNGEISSKLDDYTDQMKKYQDPLSIGNVVNDIMRMDQARIGAMPAIHTTAGMVATGYRPDVSGVGAAVGNMIGDNQRTAANSQAIDAQNFQNWLGQKNRELQGNAAELQNVEKLASLGITSNAHLASAQSIADYRNAELGIKNQSLEIARAAAAAKAAEDPSTPRSAAEDDLAKKQAAARVAVTTPGANIPNLARAATETAATAAGSGADNWVARFGDWVAAKAGGQDFYRSIMGTGDALKNNDVAVSAFEGAVKGIDPQIDELTKKLHDNDANVRVAAMDQINKRLSQLSSTAVAGKAGAVVGAAPTQGTEYGTPKINSVESQLGEAARNLVANAINPSAVAADATDAQKTAFKFVQDKMNEYGIKEPFGEIVKKYNEKVSAGRYKRTTDGLNQFLIDYSNGGL